ncbi:MAG: ATP-grasp domain-containing protein [Polaromonas sp.]
MGNVMMTMAEDAAATSASNFGIRYAVDEYDCLHFAQALKEMGHQVYFVNWLDLDLDLDLDLNLDRNLPASQFKRMFSFNNSAFISARNICDMDMIFVYKMEGFYTDIARFDRMLERFSKSNVINDIATIRHNMDKSYLWQLQQKGVEIIPSFQVAEIMDTIGGGAKFVIKPFRGERGKDIFLATARADLDKIKGRESDYFAQKFMPSIRNGERSLVFLGHQFQHAVIKYPSAKNINEFRCNESLGGTVAVYQPTGAEIDFCQNVLIKYEELGYPVHFSRVDIIDSGQDNRPLLLEAELLNPSVYANYSRKGEEFGAKLAAYFDRFMQAKRKAASP